MKNTKKAYRLAIYTALNGNLGGINVFDEKKRVSGGDKVYVLLSTQQEVPDPQEVDNVFITRSSIDIEIMVKTGFEATKDTQDDLEDLIREILLPLRNDDVLTAAGFQLNDIFMDSSITRNVSITDTETILQTILRITARIIQQ